MIIDQSYKNGAIATSANTTKAAAVAAKHRVWPASINFELQKHSRWQLPPLSDQF